MATSTYGEMVRWEPATPRLGLVRTIVSWVVAASSVTVAAWLVPGVALEATAAAFLVAAVIAVLNAVVPPVLAALRLPFMLALGFLLVLFADAGLLMLADVVLEGDIRVDGFGDALLASLVISAASVVLQTILGTNDDDLYSLRAIAP
jgi:putative membrane protein